MGLTRIISDLHLGHPGSRVGEVSGLRPLIEGCERVIFNGDTWEEQWSERREESANKKGELRELVSDFGVEGVFLAGNHDPGGEGGRFMKLGQGGGILVTHGDGIFPEASPFSREMSGRKGREVRELIAAEVEGDRTLEGRLERAAKISRILKPRAFPKLPVPFNFLATTIWPPGRPLQIIRAWVTLGEAGFKFLESFSPESEVLVCGHFHRSGVWEKKGRLVLNTGGLVRGCAARMVELEGDFLRYRQVNEMDGVFYPGDVFRVWRVG